jgi:hypothetical protein
MGWLTAQRKKMVSTNGWRLAVLLNMEVSLGLRHIEGQQGDTHVLLRFLRLAPANLETRPSIAILISLII